MKVEILVALAVLAVAQLGLPVEAKPPRSEQGKFRKLMKRFKYQDWTSCNSEDCLGNACLCDECVTCAEGTENILEVDWSGVGLQLANGKVPHKDIRKFLQKAKLLESFDLTDNPALLEDPRDCVAIAQCTRDAEAIELCDVDFPLCWPPTKAPTNAPTAWPTEAPRDYAAEWEAFFDGADGPNWNKSPGLFDPFPCPSKSDGTGKVAATTNKYIQCVDGYVTEVSFRNQYLDGTVDPEVIENILTSPGFVSFYISDDNHVLSTTSCIDSAHEIFKPYGPLPPGQFTADNITICEAEDLEPTEKDAWIKMFDALDGSNWNKCWGQRSSPGQCNYLSKSNGFFNKINFSIDMGFKSVNDIKYRLLQWILALSELEELDLSGNEICFSEEYMDLIGCGTNVTCTFHPSCEDEGQDNDLQ